ncbi:MAG: transporter substrate-binding domain-containing protein [Lentisphaeraceae bacterium]|nr:transporter substrate-binding domain-containing protein [Lentisphaeraceae bacterium]
MALIACSPKDQAIDQVTSKNPVILEATDEKVIRISTPTESGVENKMKQIVVDAYKSIGYKVTFIRMPAVRSMHDSDEGIHADAELTRTFVVQDSMKNSIRIPVPITHIEFCVVTKDKSLVVKKWEDLKKYTVAIINGYVLVQNKTSGKNVLKVENSEQALALLQNDRIQIAVLLKDEASYLINLLGYESIHVLSPPIEKVKVYHYINKKFKNLVPKLTKAFKELTGNEVEE